MFFFFFLSRSLFFGAVISCFAFGSTVQDFNTSAPCFLHLPPPTRPSPFHLWAVGCAPPSPLRPPPPLYLNAWLPCGASICPPQPHTRSNSVALRPAAASRLLVHTAWSSPAGVLPHPFVRKWSVGLPSQRKKKKEKTTKEQWNTQTLCRPSCRWAFPSSVVRSNDAWPYMWVYSTHRAPLMHFTFLRAATTGYFWHCSAPIIIMI